MPMLRILAIIGGIYRNQVKCLSVKYNKLFSHMILIFLNLHKILNILGETWTSQLKYFQNYSLQKTRLLKCIAASASEHPSAFNVLTGPQYCRSQQESTFILLFLSFRHGQNKKTHLLVISKSLGPFVNPLTADAKYSRHVKGKLRQPLKCLYL